MRRTPRETFALLLLLALAASPAAGTGMSFDVYTFMADPSVRIGYPRGWTVQENEMGAVVVESASDDSAGVLFFLGQLEPGVGGKEDLAATMIPYLRQFFPDLTVARQNPHPQAPDILALDATLSAEGVSFLTHMWCMANTQANIGVLIAFYAPQSRYASYPAEQILYSTLAPTFDLELPPPQVAAKPPAAKPPTAKPPTAKPPASAKPPAAEPQPSTIAGAAKRPIHFFRQEGGVRKMYSLDPATGQTSYVATFGELAVAQPTQTADGKMIAVATGGERVMLLDQNAGKGTNVGSASGQATHPTISRDGRLIAVRHRSTHHTGNITVVDPTTGGYDSTFVGVASWYKVVAYDVATGRRQAVYYEDPELPDLMKDLRAMGPAFSPTEDLLAYADDAKIHLCDAATGRQLRELDLPLPFYQYSGLTFSPDGTRIAYLSSENRGDVFEGGTVYLVVTVNIRDGRYGKFALPATVRPYSPATGEIPSIVCLDFSPDGRHVVLSGTAKEADETWYMAEFTEVDLKQWPSDVYVLDLSTGRCRRLTSDGASFDPVWKGR
ncbi:MAG: PQQ-binding-like beta-propeller repeat protein [bacterium]|nr:PQQ-binding-like beta-propeller repeat protein [bacterium]